MFYRSLLLSSFIIPPILGAMVACVRTPDVPSTPSPSTSVEAQSQLSLSQLSAKRIALLREQETLAAQETELESFIGAIQSQDVGERQQREQLRTELREVQDREYVLLQFPGLRCAPTKRHASLCPDNFLPRRLPVPESLL